MKNLIAVIVLIVAGSDLIGLIESPVIVDALIFLAALGILAHTAVGRRKNDA